MRIAFERDRCDSAIEELLDDLIQQGHTQERVMSAVGYLCGWYRFHGSPAFRTCFTRGLLDRQDEQREDEEERIRDMEDKTRALEAQTLELQELIGGFCPDAPGSAP